MKNNRLVSNLSFLSKVHEKVVKNRLYSHINSSNISNQYQSAYRKFHSTETTLLNIHMRHSSITGCWQDHSTDIACPILCLLIPQTITILSSRLDEWFGVTAKALDWFINQSINKTSIAPISPAKPGSVARKSHLTERCQRIKLGDHMSSKADLKVWSPSRVSYRSSAFPPPHHSTEQHDL